MEQLRQFVLHAVNAVGGVRDAVYLDTNAWSALVKGEVPVTPLARWANQNACFVWIARMQVAELAARRDIVEGFARVLTHLPVVLVDRGQHEFSGKPWHSVPVDLYQYLHLNRPDLQEAFVEEFTPPAMDQVREQLKRDGESFGQWLQRALAAVAPDEPRDWSSFPTRLAGWITQQCDHNCRPVDAANLDDPRRYVGLRLSFAVLFVRYFINGQVWRPTDYLDYLHTADMAYARVVVTERNLAECIRQAVRRPEVSGPELAVALPWLQDPGNDVAG